MILIDTSVWIDHLRQPDDTLSKLLASDYVLVHPFVAGEVALGSWRDRTAILREFGRLPQAVIATSSEVAAFIERHSLFGAGIGYVDASILASVSLTPGASLWTRDKRLMAAGRRVEPNTLKLN